MGAHFQEHHLSYLKPSRNKSSMKMVTESWKMTQLTPLTLLYGNDQLNIKKNKKMAIITYNMYNIVFQLVLGL